MVETLKDLLEKKDLQKGWILCKRSGEDKDTERPLVFCLSCPDKDVKRCLSFKHFSDAVDLLTEEIEKQDNPKLKEEMDVFLKEIGVQSSVNPEEANGGGETESTPEPPGKKPVKKAVKKKKKAKKAKKEKKAAPASEATPEPDPTEEAGAQEEDAPTVVEVKEIVNKKFVIVPLELDNTGIKNNIVTQEQLEPLLMKMEESGEEYSVFELGKDLKQKSNLDYLIVPIEVGQPVIVEEEHLMDVIGDFAEEDVDVKIYELGKELRYRKEIIIEEI